MGTRARASLALVLPGPEAAGATALGWPCARYATAAAAEVSDRVAALDDQDDLAAARRAVASLGAGAPVIVLDPSFPLLGAAALESLLAGAGPAGGAVTPAPYDAAAVLVRETLLQLMDAGPANTLVAAARARGLPAVAVDVRELLSVVDPVERSRAEAGLRRRLLEGLLRRGVRMVDPERVTIAATVEVAPGCELHPEVNLRGLTRLGAGCVQHQGAWLSDTTLGAGVTVWPYSVLEGAAVGDACSVGPFARLRPGTVLRRAVRIGNFVEVKKSVLESGVKANHLAYLGDATIGRNTNIGAGTVTCNYDGHQKHRTIIEDRAFIGSDTMLVAPVRIGEGASTGAGAVVTEDVPPGTSVAGVPARAMQPRRDDE